MDVSITPKKTILLMDEDVNIRLVIKKLLYFILINVKIYSSDKGPEGLGLAYITKPNIIVLDTTLPKYSGREVIDYIVTNNVFLNTKVIVLHEGIEISNFTNFGPNYIILSKRAGDFPESLFKVIEQEVEHKNESRFFRFALSIGKTVIFFSNSSDASIRDFETIGGVLPKIFNIVSFAISQLFTSIYLTLFFLLLGRKDIEENLDQDQSDFKEYRSKVFSGFIGAVSIVVIIVAMAIIISLSQYSQ